MLILSGRAGQWYGDVVATAAKGCHEDSLVLGDPTPFTLPGSCPGLSIRRRR